MCSGQIDRNLFFIELRQTIDGNQLNSVNSLTALKFFNKTI
jgi:hypothetical protein